MQRDIESVETPTTPDPRETLPGRRNMLVGAGLMAGALVARDAAAAAFDSAPQTVAGADAIVIDIGGYVSPASDAAPATAEDMNETVRQIKAFGRRGATIQGDIRRIGELRAAAGRIERDYGKIDIVVADAAIQRWMPLLKMADSDWDDVIDNNVNGTVNTVRAFAPKMVAKGKGRLILLSSMQGKHGTKDGSSYSASKWAILGLMKSAALELGKCNITVNAVIPGLVDTPLKRYEKRLTESFGETGHAPPEHPTPQQAWDERKPRVPMQVG